MKHKLTYSESQELVSLCPELERYASESSEDYQIKPAPIFHLHDILSILPKSIFYDNNIYELTIGHIEDVFYTDYVYEDYENVYRLYRYKFEDKEFINVLLILLKAVIQDKHRLDI